MSYRYLRFLAILAVVLAGSPGALQPLVTPLLTSASGPVGNEIIQIPLRWCAVEGSTAAEAPEELGETDTDSVLLRRQARANDGIWTPGAQIVFRSALTVPASFPIIEDPNPPVAGGRDALGDIVDPRHDASEYNAAVASCRKAWDKLAIKFRTPLLGPIALNINRFVKESDDPALAGWGGYTVWLPKTVHPCVTPSGVSIASDGHLAVVDFSVIRDDPQLEKDQLDETQVDAALVAHELAHVLYLSHGNGVDDDNDTFYDKWCDPSESPTAPANTLMYPDIMLSMDVITARQRGTSRDIASVYTGRQIDPSALLVNGPTLSDQRADSAGDVDIASVDLTFVEFVLNESHESVTLTLGLLGLVGPYETNEYLAFIDLDSSVETGGAPETLGFPTQVAGIDLVTQVLVDQDRRASVTVWRFDNGAFMETDDLGVEVQLYAPEGGEVPTLLSDVVTITMPLGFTDGFNLQELAIQTVARQSADGQELDVFPGGEGDDPSDQSATLLLVPPFFPACGVTPDQADPGDTVTLEVTGFGTTDQGVLIALGDQDLADGSLDDDVSSFEIVIPEDAEEGLRLISVRLLDTALTADCALQIGEVQAQE